MGKSDSGFLYAVHCNHCAISNHSAVRFCLWKIFDFYMWNKPRVILVLILCKFDPYFTKICAKNDFYIFISNEPFPLFLLILKLLICSLVWWATTPYNMGVLWRFFIHEWTKGIWQTNIRISQKLHISVDEIFRTCVEWTEDYFWPLFDVNRFTFEWMNESLLAMDNNTRISFDEDINAKNGFFCFISLAVWIKTNERMN